MPRVKDAFFKAFTAVHEAVFKLTRGRVAGRLSGMEVALVATTGRKSGERRETMLTCPLVDDGRPVLVASYYGDTRHPAWFLNLRADPHVELVMRGVRRPATARILEGDERAEWWRWVIAAQPRYATYQDKTDREIPLVILER